MANYALASFHRALKGDERQFSLAGARPPHPVADPSMIVGATLSESQLLMEIDANQ